MFSSETSGLSNGYRTERKNEATTEFERLFVEFGGADPSKTLTRDELSEALVNAIEALPTNSKIFRKLSGYFQREALLDEHPENSADSK